MTHIADFTDLGFFPLQDHDQNAVLSTRQMLVGGRIARMVDPSEATTTDEAMIQVASENGMGTLGDIHPWLFWQTEDRILRGIGSWSMAFAAIGVGGGQGSSGTSTGPGGTQFKPIWNRANGSDERYADLTPGNPRGFPTIPRGTIMTILGGTDEGSQQEVAVHTDPRLIAVNASGPGDAGTLVCDLQGQGEICMDGSRTPGVGGRQARLQSMMRVIAIPSRGIPHLRTGPGNSIAWNLTGSQQEGTAGYGMCYAMMEGRGGPITRRDPIPRLPTPITPQPRNPVGVNSLSGIGGDGPGEESQIPSDFGQFRPSARGSHGIMLLSSTASGPLHAGSTQDKHHIGTDADGHPINAGHISTNAYFYDSSSRDGPFLFEGLYPNPRPQPLKSRVHLTWDPALGHGFIGGARDGKWRWYAEYHVVIPDSGDPPGGGQRGGGGRTGTPGVPSTPTPGTPSTPGNPPPTSGPGPGTPGTPGGPTPGTPSTPGGPPPGTPGGPSLGPGGPSTGRLPTPITPQPRNPHPRSPSRTSPTTPGDRFPFGPLPQPIDPDDGKTPVTPYPKAPDTPRGPSIPSTPPLQNYTEPRQHAIERMKAAAPEPTGSMIIVGDVQPEDVGLYILHHPFAESFTEMAFRPQLMHIGKPSFTHNALSDADFIEADEGVRPQVMSARSWGAQNSEGEWDYVARPNLSRARGGLADGGLLFTPSEFEMEDYFGINSNEDVESPSTQSYLTVAPGVGLALGTPNIDGGLNAKAIVFDQDQTVGNLRGEISQLDSSRMEQILIDMELDQASSEIIVGIGGSQAFRLPRGTQAQRQSAIAEIGGEIRIVTDGGVDQVEFYDLQSTSWKTLASGGGATTFLGLTDTPANYAGAGLKAVRVNAGATALEYIDLDTIYATDADLTTHKTSSDHDGQYHTQALLGSLNPSEGASLIGIEDVNGWYVNTIVEGALDEIGLINTNQDSSISTNASNIFINAGDISTNASNLTTHQGSADHDGRYTTTTILGSVLLGEGASTIGVHDAGSVFAGTDVEAVLTELNTAILIVGGLLSAYLPLSGGTMTGAILSSVGTVLLPGLSFAGDPNTGIWHPAADEIAFSTNGAEAMRIDSSGFLGVGVSTLTHAVHIKETAGGDCLRLEGGGGFGSGAFLNFGDGDFVYLSEDTDDLLRIHADKGVRLTTNGASSYSGIGSTSPLSTWDVFGSRGVQVVTKTTTYTAADEEVILCDTSGLGAFTVTLPAASGVTGRVYTIKKIDSAANTVTVGRTGTDLIDGATSFSLSGQYDTINVVSDGSNWYITSIH